ncbi:MAG: Dabb family protein [Deltaproteobacteria bacterium]|nr:Dabb family protein [Deltaproteobacteria bacterium]
MLKHVVLLKFKTDTTDMDIQDIEAGLAGLPGRIPEIKGYELGRDVVRSDRSYDFGLVSAFVDQAGLKAYQTHPDHVGVVNKIRIACDSIVAVDFMTD